MVVERFTAMIIPSDIRNVSKRAAVDFASASSLLQALLGERL